MLKTDTYTVKVNGEDFVFDIPSTEALALDMSTKGAASFHVLQEGKAFQADVLEMNIEAKRFVIRVNGRTYNLAVLDAFDELVERMGLSADVAQTANDIKAPMPGLVLKIPVEVGQSVSENEAVLILEAMKMENVIKPSGAGIIKAIHVKEGEAVDKGQLLIEME